MRRGNHGKAENCRDRLIEKKMKDIRKEKNELRALYKGRRRTMSIQDKALREQKLCRSFLSSVTYRYSHAILAYAPMHEEIDITDIIRQALQDGKKVAFPLCNPETCEMTFHTIKSLDLLNEGHYHLLEPPADTPVYEAKNAQTDRAVCLVPGLVFDREGYRVGYGKGYYDRYLTAFHGISVGVVYYGFLVPEVPRGRFDMNVDVLVTEKGVIAVHANEKRNISPNPDSGDFFAADSDKICES